MFFFIVFLISFWYYKENYIQLTTSSIFSSYYYDVKGSLLEIDGKKFSDINKNQFNHDEFYDFFQEWGLDTNKFDRFFANIKLLKKEYESAESILPELLWEDFFNLGNIVFLESYEKLIENDNKVSDFYKIHDSFDQAIRFYNQSAQILGDPTARGAEKIIENRVSVYNFRFLLGIKICAEIFSMALERIDSLIDRVDNILQQFIKQTEKIEDRKDEITDNTLKECLNDYYDSLIISYENVLGIRSLLLEYEEGALSRLEKGIENPYMCVSNSKDYYERLSSAFTQIEDSLDSYSEMNGLLLEILEEEDKDTLRNFCESSDEYSEYTQDVNQDLNEGLGELDDMLNPEDQQPVPQPEEQEGDPFFEYDEEGDMFEPDGFDEDGFPGAGEPYHEEIPEDEQDELRDMIRENAERWIEEMLYLRGEEGYNPSDYLDQFFGEFYGGEEGFGGYELDIREGGGLQDFYQDDGFAPDEF
ncbi:hypothetical protein [Candidatus Absconditicoccus praedator]|uniref:hypothetical protein n=1 Tax=Candidatus Absconditicoccus praedator TaxID=2735562 RepID=UPI001E285B4B|nr:hypothetical protein [Candidatus Absconditicoccus praedator]